MKKHTLRFRATNHDTFLALKDGRKRIETRAATPLYRKIEVGDKIEFVCGNERFIKSVATVELFDSIKQLMRKYTPQDINPKYKSVEELTKMYMSFPDYPEKLSKYGIIALELK